MAAAAAVALLALTSTGDTVLLAALVALSGGLSIGFVAGLAAAGVTLLRWGTTSLPNLAGAQAVLGPAFLTGPELAAAATALASVSLLLVPAARRLAWGPTVALALVAATFASGPAYSDPGHAAVRVGSAAVAAAAALALRRWMPGRWAAPGAMIAAAVALTLGVML